MQHHIPLDELGPAGVSMAQVVETCVHCGFCLPACPTYNVLREEMDSPRGRIVLMKSVLEGNASLEQALPYIDRCLGCLGCVTACPSGVSYGELLIPFREYAEQRRRRPIINRFSRRLVETTLPNPGLFELAARVGKAARPLRELMPENLLPMVDLLPASLPTSKPLPLVYPAKGTRRARVALLTGCVQQVLEPEINWATLRVLARNGVEVVIPPGQRCCGALAIHIGQGETARRQAIHNLQQFPPDVDAILTNAAGCGSGMHEYPRLLEDSPWVELASTFSAKVKDVSQFLDEMEPFETPASNTSLSLAYLDACHLLHAQGIAYAPRRLLQRIPNLTLLPIPEGEMCCGSAGIYNLEQPEVAGALGERKALHIIETGAQAVACGNVGCMVQIRAHLGHLNHPLPVWHTIQVLDLAYHSGL